MLVSLVIPFYNEEQCLNKVVDPLVETLETNQIDYELALVDNGSWDNTGKLIDQKVSQNPRIKKIRVEVNQGYGWGILTGLRKCQGAYLGYLCGDGQIKPDDVVKTIRHILKNDSDFVKVRRVKRMDHVVRRWVSKLYDLTVPLIFSLKVRDLNGTPKIFKRQYLDMLDLQSKDWFLDAELLIKWKRLKLEIDEIPVVFYPRLGGSSHLSLLRAIWQFAKNAYRFRTNKELVEWEKKRVSRN
ncbi:glycosyltransferase family 2 protein [Candidatus Uhrbacteria bacterium]|nr:glycosyltransferase family 2 protein [Candidatus Uhrbacteria bacterium]